ncbi:MAG: alpha-glucan family phosphorylase [Phycisphaerae bacterium]|nr:alpha-glucan family phosphorylase [Phycisphaerae bacterium]
MTVNNERRIAYFSMEIGLEEGMPTYSGGLGILAGDTIQSAADLGVPIVAVTLLHRKGYFFQKLTDDGWQTEEPVAWVPQDYAEELPQRVVVNIEGRPVKVRAWKYEVKGFSGYSVPVYLLDTDLEENAKPDRMVTDHLYGHEAHYRLCQEIVLGIGGVKMLRALGYNQIERFHMNEGHAGLLTLELLEEELQKKSEGATITGEDIEAVRRQCVFTTHTPVAAGHDQFPMELVHQVFGAHDAFALEGVFCCDKVLNMTYLALSLSSYVNGVAKKHGEVSRQMFSGYKIDAITNGIHVGRWTSEPFQKLFDEHIPGWREDNFSLRYALGISCADVQKAHAEAKRELIEHVNQYSNTGMDADVLTLGFARRSASYKRADLLFSDLDRLRRIASKIGRFQIVFAGKAHPRDTEGKELIKGIYASARDLRDEIRIAYLPNYDISIGRLMTGGVDVWLNTPQPPLEASGTSGMKAAVNGVPSLSILDGWWIEGCIEGVTGWAIGHNHRLQEQPDRAQDAQWLYEKLEHVVDLYYNDHPRFCSTMLHAIALNGSFFNTQRMMQQYVLKAYFV